MVTDHFTHIEIETGFFRLQYDPDSDFDSDSCGLYALGV